MSVTLHTTHGPIKLELYCESCPETCTNFLALCASNAYTGTPFHRIVANFMIQGGDTSLSPSYSTSNSTSTTSTPIPKGGASIYSPGPFFADEIRLPALRHTGRGVLSMANKGPNTNASQFFITLAEAKHLDGKNTVFGKVLIGAGEGEALERIEAVEVDRKYRPKKGVDEVKIEKVEIHANPFAV